MPKDKEYNYGQELKDIRFRVTDDDHARLLIRLRHNKIPMSMLFRAVIDGVIEEDPNITEVLEDFGFLDEADKENLFDLIAQEFPDL